MDVKAFNAAFKKLQELESPTRTAEADKFLKKLDYFYFPSLTVWSHWDYARTVKLHQPFDLARTVDCEQPIPDVDVDTLLQGNNELKHGIIRRDSLPVGLGGLHDKKSAPKVSFAGDKKSEKLYEGQNTLLTPANLQKLKSCPGVPHFFPQVIKYSHAQDQENAKQQKKLLERRNTARGLGVSSRSSKSDLDAKELHSSPSSGGKEEKDVKKSSSALLNKSTDDENEDEDEKKKLKLPPLQLGPHISPYGMTAVNITCPRTINRVENKGQFAEEMQHRRDLVDNYYDEHLKYLYLIKRTPVTQKMKNLLLKKPDRITRAMEIIDEFARLREVSRQHTNLTKFFACYRSSTELVIISAFEPARDLQTWIKLHRRGIKEHIVPRLEWADISYWVAQVTHAIAYLHYNDLIHRNVKPSNVFLEPLGPSAIQGGPHFDVCKFYKLKLGDWGSALFRYYGDSIKEDDILSWPPEVIVGDAVTSKSDLWGIGNILWQLCTLKPPFSYPKNATDVDKRIAYVEKVVTFGTDVPDLTRFGEEKFPKRYVKAFPLLRLLFAKEPKARPTCGDLLACPDSSLRFSAQSVEDHMSWTKYHPTLLTPSVSRPVKFMPDGEPPKYTDDPLPPQPWHVLPPTLCEALSIASFQQRKKKLLAKARFFAKTKLMLRQNFGQTAGNVEDDDEDGEKKKDPSGTITEKPSKDVVVSYKTPDPETMIRNGGDRYFGRVERLKAKATLGRVGLKGLSKKKHRPRAKNMFDNAAAKLLKKPILRTFLEVHEDEMSPSPSPRIKSGGNFESPREALLREKHALSNASSPLSSARGKSPRSGLANKSVSKEAAGSASPAAPAEDRLQTTPVDIAPGGPGEKPAPLKLDAELLT